MPHPASSTDSILADVQRLSNMAAKGLPRQLILDDAALFGSDVKVPPPLYRKLHALADNMDLAITVITNNGGRVRDNLHDMPKLTVAGGAPGIPGLTIAIYGTVHEQQPGVYAWYVGNGQAPQWMHSSRQKGPAGAATILGYFGTSIVQEKAGAAFRAAGSGRAIPDHFAYDAPRILPGITALFADHAAHENAPDAAYTEQLAAFKRGEYLALMEQAYPAINDSCAPNGAIAAAAPPRTGEDPDYRFFWQRDAGQTALGMRALAAMTNDAGLRHTITDKASGYVQFAAKLPDAVGRNGLGTSRCKMDGTPVRSYGNPQLDGPAYTALALMDLGAEDAQTWIAVKPYLDFLSSPDGSGLTFDAWEFSVGEIFATLNLGRRALRQGAKLAELTGDQAAAKRYHEQAARLEQRLAVFYDQQRGYITAGRALTMPWMAALENLDIAVIGSVLTAYDVTDNFMNVDDRRMRQTMLRLEAAFADHWTVNSNWHKTNAGMGIGRFPEDMNDGLGSTGGNPWTFATLWAAQYYLRLVQRYDYLHKPDMGESAREPLLTKADGFVRFVLAHQPVNALSEQIDGRTGKPRGAPKLAWAHAELIITLALRARLAHTRGQANPRTL